MCRLLNEVTGLTGLSGLTGKMLRQMKTGMEIRMQAIVTGLVISTACIMPLSNLAVAAGNVASAGVSGPDGAKVAHPAPAAALPGGDDDDEGGNDFADDAKAATSPLRSLLRQASRERIFILPGAAELAQAEQLFVQLLQGKLDPQSPKARAAANALALDLQNAGGLTVLAEQAGARRGRGFFAFRPGQNSQDVLQVPHSFKDEMTRDIGLSLFQEGHFAAVAFNTVPRRFPGANGQEVVADMAHIDGTYFLAFTRATARVLAQGRTVQIHGFDQGKRKSAALADTDVILSAGHAAPPASLRQSRAVLEKRLQRTVALYADGVRELGATTNVEAAALRALGYTQFIHVEMSRAMRSRMRDDAATRKIWLASIMNGGSA